jgi:transcriptional regulator with XRE-family HTH domain
MVSVKTWDGSALQELRSKRGWSQQRLAWEASTDVGTISRLERGKHGPQAQTLAAIAAALGVDAGAFFKTEETAA